MPEFMVTAYAPRGATGLAARCAGEAATADQASEPGPARNAPAAFVVVLAAWRTSTYPQTFTQSSTTGS
jgi:hypothetical protein